MQYILVEIEKSFLSFLLGEISSTMNEKKNLLRQLHHVTFLFLVTPTVTKRKKAHSFVEDLQWKDADLDERVYSTNSNGIRSFNDE